jgi:hypothetical protein
MVAISEIKTEIEMMKHDQTIKHLRGDADSTFGKIVQEDEVVSKVSNVSLGPSSFRPNVLTTFLSTKGIELYFQPSKFVNKNRVLDRAIRTIRDRVGRGGPHPLLQASHRQGCHR